MIIQNTGDQLLIINNLTATNDNQIPNTISTGDIFTLLTMLDPKSLSYTVLPPSGDS